SSDSNSARYSANNPLLTNPTWSASGETRLKGSVFPRSRNTLGERRPKTKQRRNAPASNPVSKLGLSQLSRFGSQVTAPPSSQHTRGDQLLTAGTGLNRSMLTPARATMPKKATIVTSHLFSYQGLGKVTLGQVTCMLVPRLSSKVSLTW